MFYVNSILCAMLGLWTTSAIASGYQCQSECVVIDSSRFRLYILEQASYRGAVPQDYAYEELKRDCNRKAQAAGFRPGSGHIYDEVSWKLSAYKVAIDIKTKPASMRKNCIWDESIHENEIPYTGDLDFKD